LVPPFLEASTPPAVLKRTVSDSDAPTIEIRWAIEGCPYTFGTKAQATAFAKPGQQVYPVQRQRPPQIEIPFDPLEWDPS